MDEKEYVSFVYDNPEDIGRFDFVPFIKLSNNEINRKEEGKLKDPDFHCAYALKKKPNTPNVLTEEALKTMLKCPICDFDFKQNLEQSYFKFNLCNYLDADKQNDKKHFIYLHRRGEFEIVFDVKKGNKKANDSDGFVEVQVTPAYKGIEIISTKKVKTAYNSQIKVKLKVKEKNINEDGTCKYSTELFQLDFFATDNNDEHWYDWEGEAKGSIHCGQFNIISRNCICENWPEISSIIPVKDFVGWSAVNNICYENCVKQLKAVGYKDAVGWLNETSKDLFQIFKDASNDEADTKKKSDRINDLDTATYRDRFTELIDYLKNESLNLGIPLIAGVDDAPGHPGNGDKTTDHFIVIVGMGKDDNGCYLLFYDNATSIQSEGTSSNNKLYCDCKNYIFSGKGDSSITYIANTTYKEYVITHVRKSKKIK